jgi:hypothetical protein
MKNITKIYEHTAKLIKCTKSYLDESFDRFENEAHNGSETDRNYQELKEKYGW